MVAADLSSSSAALQQQQQQQSSQQVQEKKGENVENARSPLALSEKNNVGALRKPRNREITSRYKSAISASAASSAVAATVGLVGPGPGPGRRHPSPTLGRNAGTGEVPTVKRAISAERSRRPWAATSSSADPKLALSTSSDGLWSSKRTVGRAAASGSSSSGAGILWPSSQSQVSQSDATTPASGFLSRRQSPARERSLTRPQTPSKDGRSQPALGKEGRSQKESRPQTPVKDARPQTPVKDARPQTPVKDGRPQTPAKDGSSQTAVRDGRPQTPVRDRREKEPVAARRESPKREAARRDSPKRDGGLGSENALRPTANGVHRAADPPSRKGSPLRRQNTDQSENARPVENSPGKPDLQRWPGSSSGKSSGPASMSRSMDLGNDRDRPLSRAAAMLVQSQPVSSTLGRSMKPVASRSFSRSATEGPAATSGSQGTVRPRGSLENKGRSRLAHDTSGKVGVPQEEAQGEQAAAGGVGPEAALNRVRQVQQEAELAGSDTNLFFSGEMGSDTDSVSSSGSLGSLRGPNRGTMVAARFWQHIGGRVRRLSEGVRSAMSEPDLSSTGGRTGRQLKAQQPVGAQSNTTTSAINGTTPSWAMSPGRATVSAASTTQTPLSPSKPSSPSRGVSPTRQRLPAPGVTSVSRASSVSGVLNFGIDARKGKKIMTQQEEAQLLRVLHNRWLQWRFVNARADAAMTSQRITAEKSLYSVWASTSELQASVTSKRIQLQQARQAQKLDSILSSQSELLENWVLLEQEHTTALAGVTEALESAILRVPVTGGARADLQAVREALGSACEVMNAVEYSVGSLLPKAEKMEILLCQLSDTAFKERAILAECGQLLDAASTLEIEERSLRTHLMQLESEKSRMLKLPLNGGFKAAASDPILLDSP